MDTDYERRLRIAQRRRQEGRQRRMPVSVAAEVPPSLEEMVEAIRGPIMQMARVERPEDRRDG